MTELLGAYVPIAIFIGLALVIGLALLIAPFAIAYKNPDPEKLSAYECGFNAFDDARMKFDVRFYLVSILFIWVFALLNMKGVEFSGRFQFWAVVTRLTCIAVLGVSAVHAFLTTDIELPAAVPRVSRC